jgi:hypothetical protein
MCVITRCMGNLHVRVHANMRYVHNAIACAFVHPFDTYQTIAETIPTLASCIGFHESVLSTQRTHMYVRVSFD